MTYDNVRYDLWSFVLLQVTEGLAVTAAFGQARLRQRCNVIDQHLYVGMMSINHYAASWSRMTAGSQWLIALLCRNHGLQVGLATSVAPDLLNYFHM